MSVYFPDYQYEDFVGSSKMLPIMQRAVWLHIDLPGQGDGDEELPASYVFPPIQRLPEAMKSVLDQLKIKQVVLFGDGAGANILARFAIMYDNLVLGAILINCTGASASCTESLKDKFSSSKNSKCSCSERDGNEKKNPCNYEQMYDWDTNKVSESTNI
ncbi:unnamed protein product [Calicophoron daubneyi]|uniref:Uncharacterized protein n=1 Tax=Calicophoron daubneyi TaxID=300641 RepID=A0AAV2T117_CALDB